MILGVPSVQQWERVKVINKLVRCLEWLSIGWCLCVCIFDDAGVSVSERCLKGVKIVRWWVLCSQITASDKALENHWLYRYLSSAPYLRWRDVSLSSRGLSKDRFPPCTTMQRCAFKSSQAACSQTRLTCQQVHTGLSLHLEPCAAAGFGDEPSCRYVKETFRRQSLPGCAFCQQGMTGGSARKKSRHFSVCDTSQRTCRQSLHRTVSLNWAELYFAIQ